MKISEIVQRNEGGEFRSDVQLRWYAEDNTENLALARQYMFTCPSAGEHKSPTDVLYKLKQAYLLDTYENRFVVIATYGHGKSHLALALANFFGKPADSEEVSLLMKSIRFAFGHEPEAESYWEFKQGRKRHLVVCIEGTRPGDLSQLFLDALQKALRDQPETADVQLPFWTEKAREFLDRIDGDEADNARANEFLRAAGLDLAGLKARVESEDVSSYQTVRELGAHLFYGIAPDLGGQVSLAKAVEWVADNLCGVEDEKPFSGMLILFDEFSAFVRSYALRGTPGNPLQDLLDGVSSRKGKVVFVAFGQSDPDSTALGVFNQHPDDQARSALLLELERLPHSNRFYLYTTMERVLDSYLSPKKEELTAAFDDGNAWPAVSSATDESLILFKSRYEQELRWDAEQFQEIVTFGAFPLHPVTTALLCNVELQESASPRSVLGFVTSQLEMLADQPVVSEGIPCWARAVALVDWFQEQLADEEWQQYAEALRQRGGDLTSTEGAVLKGMLLHSVGKMPTQMVSFARALVHLTGLSQAEVEGALQGLAESTVIEHITAANKYSFWPVGGGARLLQGRINREMSGRGMNWTEWARVNGAPDEYGLQTIPVAVEWGHPDDWGAPQFLLPREFATPERIRELVKEAAGSVIWFVARNDADVDWFDQNAQQILVGVGGTVPQPIAIACPSRPSPLLLDALFKYAILASLTRGEVTDFGANIVQTVKNQARLTAQNDTRLLISTTRRICVPAAYDAAFRAGPPTDRADAVLQRLYPLAYSSAPPAFFTQYRARTNTNLRTAVAHLGKLLLHNQVYTHTYEVNRVAKGLVDNFLIVGKPASWGLLSLEERLQEPQSSRTRRAWDVLCQAVPPNGTDAEIKTAILTLQSPPFAYDQNTLSLLFTAWYGYHRHDLRLSVDGVVSTADSLQAQLENNPSNFITFLTQSPIRISRKNREAAVSEAMSLVERSRQLSAQPLSKQDAKAAIAKLAEFLADERNEDPGQRSQVSEAKGAIEAALQRAEDYDQNIRRLREAARGQTDMRVLVNTIGKLGEIQEANGVLAEEPPISQVRTELHERLAQGVEVFCRKVEQLPDLTHYEQRHQQLNSAKVVLKDYLELQGRIHQALQTLESRKSELEAKGRDAELLAQLQVISAKGPLPQLRGALACVSGATCHCDEARTALSRKKAELEEAISELVTFASALQERLGGIVSGASLAQVRIEITERRLSFADTPEMAQIQAALGRCDRLQQFLRTLSAVNSGRISTRAEYDAADSSLRVLKTDYSSELSAPQAALVCRAEECLRARVPVLEREADEWLASMQSRLDLRTDITGLVAQLSQPPEFLAPSKAADLQRLVATARELADKDVCGRIRSLFQQIADRQARCALVEELRNMADER